MWQEVTDHINACGMEQCTVEEVHKRMRDLIRRTNETLGSNMVSTQATAGGSQHVVELTPFEEIASGIISRVYLDGVGGMDPSAASSDSCWNGSLAMTNNEAAILSPANHTGFTPSSLVLVGIPGLEAYHIWFAAPLLFMYIVTLVGNCFLLLSVKTLRSLHKPMYLLISLLSFSDMVLSSSILPKMLAIFWLNDVEISFAACLIQMFLINVFAAVESGILTAMAIDRYIAVCHPLRYSTIITNSLIPKIAAVCLSRAVIAVLPEPLLAIRVPFCSRSIVHSFCEHIAVVKLSCTNISLNSAYGVGVTLAVGAMDLPSIFVSYFLILRAVLNLPHKDRFKAFSTCISHICVMSLFYIPILFSLSLHRLNTNIPPYVHIIVVNAYLLLPPVANPLIYGARMAEIRHGVLQLFQKEKARLCLCN
ncbi:olfactory receptor 52K1-like [Ambystoma mexicanum]|uniref:olfactory receptor 52K1-like n=1 Tax=Ambystoma mexicanum TaxID=8296 RepID=UPI0037E707CD